VRLIYAPFSIALGLVAGAIGKKVFDTVWGLIDEEEPPESEHRDVPWLKVIAAAALQGAIFRTVRIVADRGLRAGFLNLTGRWPGEEKPEAE
jgi:hypothetical protein